MIMKKVIALMGMALMVICITACGSGKKAGESEATPEDKTAETVEGGWEMASNEAAALPEDVQTAFDKASETFTGSDLKPVAYVADQVVAGTNYMILCEATTTTADPESTYQMVVIYADLKGNAEITSIKEFSLDQYLEEGDDQDEKEQLAGGWSVPEEPVGSVIPEEAKDAFDKAAETITGNTIEPIALLKTQIVSGTNYAFICKGTPVVQDPVPVIQIVTVYADLDGNAEISTIHTMDPADYN